MSKQAILIISVHTFQLMAMAPNISCEDTDPKLCATFGRFNPDACNDAYVEEKCPKSCKACGINKKIFVTDNYMNQLWCCFFFQIN